MHTLLLVDDRPEKLKEMERVARAADRRIVTASDLVSALSMIGREALDLVITDLSLRPEGNDQDGLAVLSAIRKKDPEVPVILVSNFLAQNEAEEALKGGVFYIIDRASSRLLPDSMLRLKIGQALRFREAMLQGTH
jgi:DNA-binding NtrC family response regulator